MPHPQHQQVRHQELLLELNADCAEFCDAVASGPHHPDSSSLLAVGTYQLDEASNSRHGRLLLYSLCCRYSCEDGSSAALHLQELATQQLPGIFDLKWLALPAGPCIGLALADGSLRIVRPGGGDAAAGGSPRTQEDAEQAAAAAAAGARDSSGSSSPHDQPSRLQEVCSCAAAVSEGMALSLDWRRQPQESQQQLAAVSSSSGAVSVLQVGPAGVDKLQEWTAHELEVWMAAWDRHQPNVLYSGADDAAFKGWDIRCPRHTASSSSEAACDASEEPDSPTPLFSNRKAHGAGVCCISSHPRREHVLATGSYDEAVRLWDVRMLQRPLETCQVPAGGGVWRLKWHPRDDHLLLAACMYNGCALVAADSSWGSLEVMEEYKGHESIAYGADWFRGSLADVAAGQPGTACEGSAALPADVVATCSFYDRRLHLWSPAYCAGRA